jgi:uncharacterized protein YciI
MELEEFELVILRRPARPPSYDEKTSHRIQQEHRAYLAGLRESGHVVVNGPVVEQPDESLRALVVLRTGSLADARRLMDADPAIRAGRFEAEIMHWRCPPGLMPGTGRVFTAPD